MTGSTVARIRRALERSWYVNEGAWVWLKPLAWLFGLVIASRRLAYAKGWLKSTRVSVPVLVIGNISVGGSGKTPLVISLAVKLAARGQRVGVVSRGYGGKASRYPLRVNADTPPAEAGDEPVLIARQSAAFVAVDPDRARAAQRLIDQEAVDILVADDGLQHYALARDAEIAVIDARRGTGNGWLLPAGPLREPCARLDRVDLVITQGADFRLAPSNAVALADGTLCALSAFANQRVHAVAGIGDPVRFFAMLRDLHIDIVEHPMPDHHAYRAADIMFDDKLSVLMTEKDAVKCSEWANSRHWSVPVELIFSSECETRIDALLNRLCDNRPPEVENKRP